MWSLGLLAMSCSSIVYHHGKNGWQRRPAQPMVGMKQKKEREEAGGGEDVLISLQGHIPMT